MHQLQQQALQCRGCGLCETRKQVVFGKGNPASKILFVGEAPGKDEDETGLPFVGRAGKLLDEMLLVAELGAVYITNIVKCRPPNNRDPLPVEQDTCIRWLWAQIELIQPRLLVCVGRISASRLIKPDLRITRDHGQWVSFTAPSGNVTADAMAIYHPAFLLRDPRRRPEAFADLRKIHDRAAENSLVG